MLNYNHYGVHDGHRNLVISGFCVIIYIDNILFFNKGVNKTATITAAVFLCPFYINAAPLRQTKSQTINKPHMGTGHERCPFSRDGDKRIWK